MPMHITPSVNNTWWENWLMLSGYELESSQAATLLFLFMCTSNGLMTVGIVPAECRNLYDQCRISPVPGDYSKAKQILYVSHYSSLLVHEHVYIYRGSQMLTSCDESRLCKFEMLLGAVKSEPTSSNHNRAFKINEIPNEWFCQFRFHSQ